MSRIGRKPITVPAGVDVAAGGDPPVGQQRRQPRHRARADLDRQRRADHAGQERHMSRARARSAWSSTSTHSTSPIGAVPTLPPRSANSWKPSS